MVYLLFEKTHHKLTFWHLDLILMALDPYKSCQSTVIFSRKYFTYKETKPPARDSNRLVYLSSSPQLHNTDILWRKACTKFDKKPAVAFLWEGRGAEWRKSVEFEKVWSPYFSTDAPHPQSETIIVAKVSILDHYRISLFFLKISSPQAREYCQGSTNVEMLL